MCGISGFLHYDKSRPVSLSALQRMSEAVKHRGPDGQGLYAKGNLAMAHQRLAIIDLSSGDQPMFNEDKSIVIIFNGEIYNYLELRDELKLLGHRFITKSDTEVLIHAYEEWGVGLHNKLNGMWAFAIWDDREKILLLSRDRVGEKPLHYAQYNDTLLFASEIKSILAYGFPREANMEMLEIYLSLGYIPAPFSFIKNIKKLMPGHYAIIKDGHIRTNKYWDLPEIDEQDLLKNQNDVSERFQSLFHDSIRLRMRSDVSYGAFLSGGLDSASVVAVMSQISKQPVETFTVGFDEEEYDESTLASEVAGLFNTSHHLYKVTQDSFEDSLWQVLHSYDEPFGDSSAIPTGYVSKYASQRVKMVLTGDGGDEVLSGYNAYQSEKFASQYNKLPEILRGIPPGCIGLASKVCSQSRRRQLDRYNNILKTSNMSFNDRLQAKSAWADISLVRRLLTSAAGYTMRVDEYLGDVMKGCSYKDNFYRMMYYHTKLTLPEDMLTKVDRMSMAYSLETRIPFLDYRLIEFMAHVHKDIKMIGYERKSILRRTIGKSLPRSLLRAPKKGFVVPVHSWFKNKSLVAPLPKLLSRTPLNINTEITKEIINMNATGQKDYGNFIWMLFLLGAWFQV